jgi:hypothetical protein
LNPHVGLKTYRSQELYFLDKVKRFAGSCRAN